MTPAEVLKFAEKNGAKMVDFKFIDLLGIWQHTTMPIGKLEVGTFKDGYFFDGSSIRGWQPIHASDMIFIPDPNSARDGSVPDTVPTLSLTCDIVDAITKQPYPKDPRTIAAKAEAYLKSTGIGDTSYFGPEPEFFVFDEVRYSEGPNRSSYMVDSIEGRWNSDREESPNLGYKPAHKGGYFPVPPTDTLTDLRTEMALTLEALGIPVEVFHHEVASGGQCELSMKFNSLKAMADWTMWYKYVVKNVARKHGKTATFMPKPISPHFKAYDVRGVYPDEIDEDIARRVGNAFAVFTGAERLVVAHDMRPSSVPLSAAFIEGATLAGASVVDAGLASTDLIYFAAGRLDAPGAMFTASHNPAQYNGIKLCKAGAAPVGAGHRPQPDQGGGGRRAPRAGRPRRAP